MRESVEKISRTELGDIARAVFDTARCVVIFLDLDGKVAFLNPHAEEMLGWPVEEVLGKNWIEEFVPEEGRARLREVLDAVKQGEEVRPDENEVLCKDGSRRRFAWTDCPIRDGSGKVTGVVGIGIDVSVEHGIRKELEDKESRIRAAMENMVDGFITIDDRETIESFNPAAERMFGYAAGEVIGRSVHILMPEPHQREHDEHMSRYLRTGEARIIGVGREVAGLRKDGSTFPLSLAVAEMPLGGRRMFVGTLRDLSKEKALLSAVESEQRLKAAIVEASTDAVLGLDEDGRILSWNPAAVAILGYEAEEALGRHYSFLIPPDSGQAGETERIERIFQERGDLRNYATRRRRKDGREIQVILSRTALRNDEGELIGYSAILRDVTEENLLREQVHQSEKFSAIGELAAGLAHEIGGPLSVISGNAEFLIESLDAEDPRREDAEGVAKECESVASLIRRLLDFSKPAMLETGPVDVNECLRNILFLVRKQISKEAIEIKLDLQVGLPPILGDSNQLEQVVMNLLMNARRAMPEGGRLTIESFSAVDGSGDRRRNVGVRIQDTGVGIAEKDLPRIFDPFFTTREPGEGTGLGLAVSRRIVTDHQGKLSVASRLGEGAAFTIELPAMEEETGE
jgi:PAS domain S-box-containing protein